MEPLLTRLALCGTLLLAPALLPGSAEAATLGVFTHDYGTDAGRVLPLDYTSSRSDRVRLRDSTQSSPDVAGDVSFDEFSLASLAAATIDSIEFTLTFDGAQTNGNEEWYLDIYGSVPGPFTDNRWTLLDDAAGIDTLTLTLDASTDVGGIDAFATILSRQTFAFGFDEDSSGRDWLDVYSASITVFGTAATVPIPAPGLLLLGALGWLAHRRRKGAAGPSAAA